MCYYFLRTLMNHGVHWSTTKQHDMKSNVTKEEDTDLSVSLVYDSGDLDLFPPHCQISLPPRAKEDYQWDPGGQEVNSS